MSETKMVTMNVDPAMVAAVLKEKVEEAVGVALIDREQVAAALIDKCLTLRVDSEGKPTTYYQNSRSFVEWAATKAIQDAVHAAMAAVMEKRAEALKKAVEVAIMRSKSKLAASLVDGLAKSLTSRWSSTVEIRFDSKDKNEE